MSSWCLCKNSSKVHVTKSTKKIVYVLHLHSRYSTRQRRSVRMKLFMLPLSLTAAALALDLDFASDVAFDCPMLETKINGALSEVLPDVTSWEECGR